ncbi:hypothetical protein [Sphaerisporangium sp. NPDC051011]|uniref:hypothetical protein n=1 Tax=Sphaerisporangium sp. NPDC051011 TaxID=3155792 RepID=UPI0033EC866D
MGGSDINAASLDPSNLITLLAVAGWGSRGGRPNVYERWEVRDEDERLSVLIPLDPSHDDYTDLLEEALLTLSKSRLPSAQSVFSRLRTPGDEVHWQKEPHAIPGLISWSQGEALITSAKQILLAAAKAARRPSAYHGQREWRFAREYLEKVFMGQTRIGSYVVTAYTPTGPIREVEEAGRVSQSDPSLSGTERLASNLDVVHGSATTGRDVMNKMTASLIASREAIEHFASTGSLSGFDAGVGQGVSYELTRALASLVTGSDGAQVSVYWFPVGRSTPAFGDAWTMEFLPDDLPALEKASTRLASTEPRRTIVVVGTVTNLSRPKFGLHGTIVLNVIYGASVSRVRVRLSRADYEQAISAHQNGDLLRVTGDLEKDGNNYWLYNPAELGAVEAGAFNQAEMFGAVDPDLLRAQSEIG